MPRTIKVPKTPSSAYGPDRKPSALLKSMLELLEAGRRKKGAAVRGRHPRKEALAARYITELTEQLHPRDDAAGDAPSETDARVDALMKGLRRKIAKPRKRAAKSAGTRQRRRASGRAKK